MAAIFFRAVQGGLVGKGLNLQAFHASSSDGPGF